MLSFRRIRPLLPTTAAFAAAAATLAMPTSAHAILVGMESNRELVNTNQSNEQREAALDLMKEQGVQLVRANFRWYEIANGCEGQSAAALANHANPCYDWSRLDHFVGEANERRMQVLLSMQQNPAWLHNGKSNRGSDSGYYMGNSAREFARTLQHYASFHKAAATRYRRGSGNGFVKFWTVHNEPNSKFYWGGPPNAARYAQLYGATAKAIRAGNPHSRIAPGPTGPTGGSGGIKPRVFVAQFQQRVGRFLPGGSIGAKKRYINAWAHNPYPDARNAPSYSARNQHRDTISMGTIDKLTRQLDANPLTRGTKIWATEFGWQTAPERVAGTSTALQAQFIAEAFDWLHSKRRVEIGVSYGLTDPREVIDWQSGTIAFNGVRKPAFRMFQRMISVQQAGKSGVVRSGTRIRVWGRSNVNPTGTRLAYRVIGGRCDSRAAVSGYCEIRGTRPARGSAPRIGYVTAKRGQRLEFAVYDSVSKTYGMPRRVTVR